MQKHLLSKVIFGNASQRRVYQNQLDQAQLADCSYYVEFTSDGPIVFRTEDRWDGRYLDAA